MTWFVQTILLSVESGVKTAVVARTKSYLVATLSLNASYCDEPRTLCIRLQLSLNLEFRRKLWEVGSAYKLDEVETFPV